MATGWYQCGMATGTNYRSVFCVGRRLAAAAGRVLLPPPALPCYTSLSAAYCPITGSADIPATAGSILTRKPAFLPAPRDILPLRCDLLGWRVSARRGADACYTWTLNSRKRLLHALAHDADLRASRFRRLRAVAYRTAGDAVYSALRRRRNTTTHSVGSARAISYGASPAASAGRPLPPAGARWPFSQRYLYAVRQTASPPCLPDIFNDGRAGLQALPLAQLPVYSCRITFNTGRVLASSCANRSGIYYRGRLTWFLILTLRVYS